MIYTIAFLLGGECSRYAESLAREVSEKFGVRFVFDKLGTHITLKAPFSVEDISEVEEFLDKFSREEFPLEVSLKGFGHFGKDVVYLDVEDSDEIYYFMNDLVAGLRKLGVSFSEFDGVGKSLHCTIAKDLGRTFPDVWEYLNGLKKPNFSVYFDKISLMVFDKDKWKLYRDFELGV